MIRAVMRVAVVAGLAAIASPSAAQTRIPPSIEFRVPKAPTVAMGDSGAFLSYELHVTNLTAAPVTLRRVEVVDGASGRTLLSLQDSALLATIVRPGLSAPPSDRAKIDGGLRAVLFLWVKLGAGAPPASVRERLTMQVAQRTDTSIQTLEGATVPVASNAIAVGAPLRGGDWLAGNGPSNASGHRRTVLALNGAPAIGQRFAIDFLRVDEKGQTFKGDRSKNANFLAYGDDVLSVADGIVVETKDSIPENDPSSASNRAVPITLVTVGGNHIVVDIGQGHFAFYAHVQPGSLRVKVGDRVKRGQVIAKLGNSGNSTEPHLHFHITDSLASGTTTLGAEGLPYLLPSFEVIGACTLDESIKCTRSTPATVRNAMPLANELVRFPK